MREINYKELYHLVEKYGKPLDEKDKASRVLDFVRPIPGHQEIRGMRLLNVDGKKALLVLKHDGEGINAKDIKDVRLAQELIIAAKERAAMREDLFKIRNPGIEQLQKEHVVTEVKEACPGFYSVRYDDGSMSLVNSIGGVMHSPMHGYDVIQDFKYLGKLQGVEHFAYKAQDWATRNRESTLGMFDIQGHEKWFRDPRLHPDSMDGIQREFDKLVKASLDPTNARRNDPMLADLGLGRDVKIHI